MNISEECLFLEEVEQELKVELLMCKRGTSSITDYLNRFKAICELLAAIHKSLLDDDKVMYILDGLDMVFVTSVSMRVPFPPFSELRSLLMAARYKPIPASSTPLATDYVLVSQVQQTTSDNRGRGRTASGLR